MSFQFLSITPVRRTASPHFDMKSQNYQRKASTKKAFFGRGGDLLFSRHRSATGAPSPSPIQRGSQLPHRAIHVVPFLQAKQPDAKSHEVGAFVALAAALHGGAQAREGVAGQGSVAGVAALADRSLADLQLNGRDSAALPKRYRPSSRGPGCRVPVATHRRTGRQAPASALRS